MEGLAGSLRGKAGGVGLLQSRGREEREERRRAAPRPAGVEPAGAAGAGQGKQGLLGLLPSLRKET